MNTPLPDVVCKTNTHGEAVLAMNKKARLFINKCVSGKVRWRKIAVTADSVISSPKYRALVLEPGPVIAAMLYSLHEAGLRALFYCDACEAFHAVEGETAEDLRATAVAGADGVPPSHPTLQ